MLEVTPKIDATHTEEISLLGGTVGDIVAEVCTVLEVTLTDTELVKTA